MISKEIPDGFWLRFAFLDSFALPGSTFFSETNKHTCIQGGENETQKLMSISVFLFVLVKIGTDAQLEYGSWRLIRYDS